MKSILINFGIFGLLLFSPFSGVVLFKIKEKRIEIFERGQIQVRHGSCLAANGLERIYSPMQVDCSKDVVVENCVSLVHPLHLVA